MKMKLKDLKAVIRGTLAESWRPSPTAKRIDDRAVTPQNASEVARKLTQLGMRAAVDPESERVWIETHVSNEVKEAVTEYLESISAFRAAAQTRNE